MSGRSLLFPSLRYSSKREYTAEQPLPLRLLLTKPVVISIVNHGTLALLEIATSALMPLDWFTVVELGGLLTPADMWMSA
ncbi:hypothetical protein EDB83DRAFT_2523369 [Lactarius deliciosus]|nr:hypothetical protein EDB83DRAFT_2523369 [Lactarius deliciosus]